MSVINAADILYITTLFQSQLCYELNFFIEDTCAVVLFSDRERDSHCVALIDPKNFMSELEESIDNGYEPISVIVTSGVEDEMTCLGTRFLVKSTIEHEAFMESIFVTNLGVLID